MDLSTNPKSNLLNLIRVNADTISEKGIFKYVIKFCSGLQARDEYDSILIVANPAIAFADEVLHRNKEDLNRDSVGYFLMKYYRLKGMSYYQLSQYPQSMDALNSYLKYAEGIKSQVDIGSAYNFMAYNHRELEDYKTSLQFNTKAISYLYPLGQTTQLANAYAHRATVFFDLQNNDSSLYYSSLAINIFNHNGDLFLANSNILNMVEVFFSMELFDSAATWLNKTKDFILENEIPEQISRYYALAGRIEYVNGHIPATLNYYNKSYDYAKEVENPFLTHNVTKHLALAQAASGKYKESLKTMTKSMDAYSEDLNLDKARAMNSIQLKNDFQKEKQLQQFKFEKQAAVAEEKIKRTTLTRNISVAGVLIGIVVAFFLLRLNRKLKQSYKNLEFAQQKIVETEKQQEAQNVRVRISRDIHDELGSGLTRITLLSDLAKKKVYNNPEDAVESLSRITRFAREVSASLNEIVWAVNPGADSCESLIIYLKTYAQKFLEDTNMNFELNFPEQTDNIFVSAEKRRNLFLVMKEAINNSVKYSHANLIKISFGLKGKEFILEIADNGVGMEQSSDAHPVGNGLLNMRSRAAQVQCEFGIESSPGQGCKIKLTGVLN